MTIIDTHSHIYDDSFDQDLGDVINRAKAAGVVNVLLPNVDIESISAVNRLAETYPDYCLPMMGLHPTSVTADYKNDLVRIKEEFLKNQYIGVGEIGIDLYWDKSLQREQIEAFEEQLRWSIEFGLPVSIHCREAIRESVQSIIHVGVNDLKGVFHSFGGDEEELRMILDLNNFYIGVNGTVTYKNSKLPSVLLNTDLSRIIVETDAPYLPPVPYRGKRNEPSYTTYIVKKLAEIYNISENKVAEITTRNAKELYSIN